MRINLLYILTKPWMRTRNVNELHCLHDKLCTEFGTVTGDIQPLTDGPELTYAERLHLERLKDSRTQLGQVLEDLEAIICEKEAGRRAA